MKSFGYSTDGIEGESFEALNFECALEKVAGWSGISVWPLDSDSESSSEKIVIELDLLKKQIEALNLSNIDLDTKEDLSNLLSEVLRLAENNADDVSFSVVA